MTRRRSIQPFRLRQIMPDGYAAHAPRPARRRDHGASWYYGAPYNGSAARWTSYEYRASCRHANIGGALAAGSAVLFNEGRREGAVWMMVMLSDGAAGASNPITRYSTNTRIFIRSQPYAIDPGSGRLSPLPGTAARLSTARNCQPDDRWLRLFRPVPLRDEPSTGATLLSCSMNPSFPVLQRP